MKEYLASSKLYAAISQLRVSRSVTDVTN